MSISGNESVVCDCGYRWLMTKEQFRDISAGRSKLTMCPKCNKDLRQLITALQKAIDQT